MSKYFTRDFEDAYIFCKMLIKNKSYKLRDVFEGEKREKNVIDLCLKSNLIIIKNDTFLPTENAISIIKKNKKVSIIGIIKSYLYHFNPDWVFEVYRGIDNAKDFIPDNWRVIFESYNLFDKTDRDIVRWWNQIKNFKRSFENQKLSDIGLEGEFLILDFEKNRTGHEPVHLSVDDDSAGYDILSKKKKDGKENLLIEVKTSSTKELKFYLSSKAFETCELNKENYLIYLIDQSNKDKKILYSFGYELIKKHIPKNIGLTDWIKTEIKTDKKFLNDCKKHNM